MSWAQAQRHMRRGGALVLALLLGASGCATHYRYDFELSAPGAEPATDRTERSGPEDEKVEMQVAFDDAAVLLELRNKTADLLQVYWNKITFEHRDRITTSLRPDVDLGWIAAGGKVTARLIPFVVPRSGTAAKRYSERELQLNIPMLVDRHPVTYRIRFVAHLQPLD